MEKINKSKSWFSEKINTIDKERNGTNYWSQKLRRDITIGLTIIKRIIKEYHKQLYAHKWDNLDDMELPIP